MILVAVGFKGVASWGNLILEMLVQVLMIFRQFVFARSQRFFLCGAVIRRSAAFGTHRGQ